VGLVWRLQRTAFLGWAVALTMFASIFGNLSEQIQGLEGNARDWWTEAGGTSQVLDAYQVSIIQMAGMFVAVYVVQVLLRMRVDEVGGTLEPVLAGGVSRGRWLWGHVLNAILGSAALMVLFAVGMGLTAGQVLGDPSGQVRDLAWAGLMQVPGVLVVGASVIAVNCVLPRWSVPVSWALMLFMLITGPMFGPSLHLPTLVQDLSPFTHSPKAPAASVTAGPALALTGLGIALVLVGLLALRRRNLALPA
jgi:ABC-2 type transport system permease protein